jgi:ABC-type sugar transport system permease subunit
MSNYLELLKDQDFWIALKNTSLFVVGTIPFTTIFALILAILVNQNIPLKGFFRAGFFVPSITSLVVIALIFMNLYAKEGYLTFLCNLVGWCSYPGERMAFLHQDRTFVDHAYGRLDEYRILYAFILSRTAIHSFGALPDIRYSGRKLVAEILACDLALS